MRKAFARIKIMKRILWASGNYICAMPSLGNIGTAAAAPSTGAASRLGYGWSGSPGKATHLRRLQEQTLQSESPPSERSRRAAERSAAGEALRPFSVLWKKPAPPPKPESGERVEKREAKCLHGNG
ncbi:uncharacterized protein WM294_013245 [Sarcoramphus papa]